MAIEQWGFSSIPRLLCHGTMELSLPLLTIYVCCGWDSKIQPSACDANALTNRATNVATLFKLPMVDMYLIVFCVGQWADAGKVEEEESMSGRVVLTLRGAGGRLRQTKGREMCLAPYCRGALLVGRGGVDVGGEKYSAGQGLLVLFYFIYNWSWLELYCFCSILIYCSIKLF